MIDIHTHMLFDIDDGPKSLDESLDMIEMSYNDGVRIIIMTPHYIEYAMETQIEEIYLRVEELKKQLKLKKMDLEIMIGQEVYISHQTVNLLKHGKITTINNSSYLLLELPMHYYPDYVEDIIFKLKMEGIIPIIAHPERYEQIRKNPEKLEKLFNLGVLCQINGGSLLGEDGENAKEFADFLLEKEAVHFIASDAHSEQQRSPNLGASYEYVKKILGATKADCIFYENPMKLIKNEIIEFDEIPKLSRPEKKKKKQWIRNFIKRKR